MADGRQVAAVLHRAIESGDVRDLARDFAANGVVWHNNDRRELDKESALARIAGACAVLDDIHVDVIRFGETSFGFVEQIVLRGRLKSNGTEITLHNCLVVTVANSCITRIDEYVDPAAGVRLSGAGAER